MSKALPLTPIYHGGALDRAMAVHGGDRQDWLDISTGINPTSFPVAPVSQDAWCRLPDSAALARLLAAARQFYGVPKHLDIVATPGTQALIEALPRLLDGGTASIVSPPSGTYREHAHCAAKTGRIVREVSTPDGVLDDETLAVLVHPNNPDGTFWPEHETNDLASLLQRNAGHLVIDEAFCDTDPTRSFVANLPENAIVLKSFGKFFGLAGVRLGFAICRPEMAAGIANWFGPWAVSGPALEIGTAALSNVEWGAQMRERLAQQSSMLAELLEDCGFEIAGKNGLFVLARHRDATRIAQELMQAKILVRPFPDRPHLLRFGLSGNGNERLASTLKLIVRPKP